jgi:hypothetical protein
MNSDFMEANFIGTEESIVIVVLVKDATIKEANKRIRLLNMNQNYQLSQATHPIVLICNCRYSVWLI